MSALLFDYDFFSPKEEDGNLSLSTRERRMVEAVKSMQTSDWIEFEDGTRCCSYDELMSAITHHESEGH